MGDVGTTNQEHPEGTTVAVRAQPGARRAGVLGVHDGTLRLAVTVPAEGGRANEALAELLCQALGVKRSQIELIAGRSDRNKVVLIRGLTAERLAASLGQLIPVR